MEVVPHHQLAHDLAHYSPSVPSESRKMTFHHLRYLSEVLRLAPHRQVVRVPASTGLLPDLALAAEQLQIHLLRHDLTFPETLQRIQPVFFRQPTPLRSIRQRQGSASDVFSDPMDEAISSSPPKFWENERSSSPATSQGGLSYSSGLSRNTSWESGGKSFGTSINTNTMGVQGKKAPPPPPPSRGAKPAPPPPPAKRSNLGTTVSTYSG